MHNRLIQHPFAMLIVTAVVAVICLSVSDLLYSVSFGLLLRPEGEVNPMAKDWPAIAARAIWISLFSAGVIGCIFNLLKAWRSSRRNYRFDLMREITVEEYQDLDAWVHDEMTPENLSMWGTKKWTQ
jgi:hypothetical protein